VIENPTLGASNPKSQTTISSLGKNFERWESFSNVGKVFSELFPIGNGSYEVQTNRPLIGDDLSVLRTHNYQK
jgi:hypothetical protein